MKNICRLVLLSVVFCGAIVLTTASCERQLRRALDPNGSTRQSCNAEDYVQLLGQGFATFDRSGLPRRWSQVPFGSAPPERIVADNVLRLYLSLDNRIVAIDCDDGGPIYRQAE